MRPLIAGNWKMHGLMAQLGEIHAVATAVTAKLPLADVLICLPATLIARAAQLTAGRIGIGGEDCHAAVSGAFTGEISAEMLKDAGASSVIVGHSERRQQHGETNAMVAAKARAASRAELQVIICIGETQTQREQGNALSVCADQIGGSMPEGLISSGTAVAYEPLWAIGTGHVPTAEQIVHMHEHIRHCLAARFGAGAKAVRILYGGSVTSSNAPEILALPEVDGALIGGASLKAAEFEGIISAASRTAARSPGACASA